MMWKTPLKWLKSPVFAHDDEKTLTAGLVHSILLAILAAALLYAAFARVLSFSRLMSVILPLLLLLTGLFVLLRRGQVRATAGALVWGLWLILVYASSLNGGVRAPAFSGFMVVVMISAFLLGARFGLLMAGASVAAGAALILLEDRGLLPFSAAPQSLFTVLLAQVTYFIVAAVVLFLFTRSVRDVLARAVSSEERYRLIASVMSDYAFSVQYGPDGEISDQWIGGAFEAITGYTPQEYFARGGWLSILHPDDREQDADDMEQLHANMKTISEVRILRKDKNVCWVRSYAHPQWDEAGNRLAGVYGAVQDITGRKQAEMELQRRAEEVSLLYRLGTALSGGENLYQALRAFVRELKQVMAVDAFHIGMYDENTDVFSYSLFLNLDEDLQPPPRKLREEPGLTWEVISNGETLYLRDAADPQVRQNHHLVWVVDAPIRSYLGIPLTLQERVIGVMSVQSLQPGAYTPDQVRLLETMASQVAITIEKLGLLDQVQQELVDRKKMEVKLQQREAILRVVADAANTFLKVSKWGAEDWRTEVDNLLERLGNAIHASHAYIFENRLAEDGSIRMSMRHEWTAPGFKSDLDDPKYADMPLEVDFLESWNDSVLSGLPFVGDSEHLSAADLDSLHARGIYALLDVPIFIDGNWWGTIGFDEMARARNWSPAEVDALVVASNMLGAVVKRRQMDSILQAELSLKQELIGELENKNAELERFTYTVSHDLRSPLVTIRGFLGYLERQAREGNMEGFRRDLERISRATGRMDDLLRDLLELSRIGRLVNKSQDVPFGDIVKDALEIVHGRLEERRVTLRIQPDLPLVHVDKPRLTEVLQNLMDNAAKYMGSQETPVIEIGMDGYDDSNRPVFFVRDNGMGIAPEYHESIFGLFDKLDPASEGTGVGLALVKRIIEFHGGRIWVQSEPGKGSTFLFTLAGGRSGR